MSARNNVFIHGYMYIGSCSASRRSRFSREKKNSTSQNYRNRFQNAALGRQIYIVSCTLHIRSFISKEPLQFRKVAFFLREFYKSAPPPPPRSPSFSDKLCLFSMRSLMYDQLPNVISFIYYILGVFRRGLKKKPS